MKGHREWMSCKILSSIRCGRVDAVLGKQIIHGYIMMKIGKTLENANKLTPFSHDCSKRILHKHHLLLRLFTRMMWYGRQGGGGSVRDMFEDLRPELGEIGMDFELTPAYSVGLHYSYQRRSDGNSQNTFGIGLTIRE